MNEVQCACASKIYPTSQVTSSSGVNSGYSQDTHKSRARRLHAQITTDSSVIPDADAQSILEDAHAYPEIPRRSAIRRHDDFHLLQPWSEFAHLADSCSG